MSELLVTTIKDAAGGSAITVPTSGTFTLGASWVLLEVQTASASATLDMETTIDSTYDTYVFEMEGLIPASDGVDLWMRVKDTTYQSDAADYEYTGHSRQQGTGSSAADSAGAAQLLVNHAYQIGSGAAEGISGEVRLYMPSSATLTANFTWETVFWDDTATPLLSMSDGAGAYNGATNAITGVRFMFSSGNITSGSVRMYGVHK